MSRAFLLSTPLYSHISELYKNCVYEPAEDTFLLIDAIEKDLEAIIRLSPLIVLEIGSGSGLVITAIASALKNGSYFISTDINDRATRATVNTASVNGVIVEAVVGDLVSSMLPRLSGMVDVLLFNPPYVLTPHEEIGKKDLTAAWAGGVNGREVMDRLFPSVHQLLSPNGLFYLVTIKENNPDEIRKMMKLMELDSEVVISRKCGSEHLNVLKFFKKSHKI